MNHQLFFDNGALQEKIIKKILHAANFKGARLLTYSADYEQGFSVQFTTVNQQIECSPLYQRANTFQG